MRKVLPLASIAFLFTSCTTYQYMTISGKDIKSNDRREFVMENDSIRLKYNFNGQDAPINVEVLNKMDKPIYIDWGRSALIINDKAISYAPASMPVSGSVSTTTSSLARPGGGFRHSSSYGDFNGSVGVPRDLDFIPPGAYKNKTPLGLTNVYFPDARKKAKRRDISSGDGTSSAVMVREYADSSSPFRFSSYVTLYTEGAPEKPVVFQHSFYISEIWTTTAGPRNFRFINEKDGDHFYVSTTNAFGKIAGGFGILAGYALVTYAEVKLAEANGGYYYNGQYYYRR
jgi:hypothetical protein